jgi:hypothetical protein
MRPLALFWIGGESVFLVSQAVGMLLHSFVFLVLLAVGMLLSSFFVPLGPLLCLL